MKGSLLFCTLALALLPACPAAGADPLARCPAGAGLSDAQRRMLHRSNGVYSLHESAAAGNTQVLAARLQEGADPNEPDEAGNSPLHLAALGREPQVLELLLRAGADVRSRDAAGKTPQQLCRHAGILRLLEAAELKRQQELALEAALRRGDKAAVRSALAAGVNPNARTADNSGYMLFAALEAGHNELLGVLITAGADVNAISPGGNRRALHLAAGLGNVAAIRALLAAGADPMAYTANRATALHDAVWNKRLEAVQELLPAYAEVNYSPDGAHNGFPVNLSMSRGGAPFVKAFLKAGLDPNAAGLRREPPLIRAAREGREDIVRLLLSSGASKTMQDASGKTAADYAPPALQSLLR